MQSGSTQSLRSTPRTPSPSRKRTKVVLCVAVASMVLFAGCQGFEEHFVDLVMLWTFDAITAISDMQIEGVGGTLYAFSEAPGLVALDLSDGSQAWVADGEVIWDFQPTAGAPGSDLLVNQHNPFAPKASQQDALPENFEGRGPVLVDDDLIVYASGGSPDRHFVSAFESEDGSERWTTELVALGGHAADHITPLAAGPDLAYVGVTIGTATPLFHLFAIETETGTIGWQETLRGERGVQMPMVSGDTLLFGTAADREADGGYLHARDAQSGEELWSVQLEAPPATPAVERGVVLAPSTAPPALLWMLDMRDGSQIGWPMESYEEIRFTSQASQPTIVDGIAYFAGWDENLYAWNTRDAYADWNQWVPGGFTQWAPTVHEGIVYAGAVDGQVYAYNAVYGEELAVVDNAWAGTAPMMVADDTLVVGLSAMQMDVTTEDPLEPEMDFSETISDLGQTVKDAIVMFVIGLASVVVILTGAIILIIKVAKRSKS